MNENEIRLIKDLYNHYDQNQEINDEFLKSLTENYGTIRGVLMNVVLKYDPEAEITDKYLDAKLIQYNIDLKSTILENDANASKEHDVVNSEINANTQEKPKPVASASKKTKRRWVLPIVIAGILIISSGLIFYVKFNDSVTLLDNSDVADEFRIIDFPKYLNGLYSSNCTRKHWTEEGYSLRINFNNKSGEIIFNIDRGFGDIKKVYFNEIKNLYKLEYDDVRYGTGIQTLVFKYNKEKSTVILMDGDELIKCLD